MNFFSLSLNERLSPSEIVLQNQLKDKANVERVVLVIHETVDKFVTHGEVVDVMHDVFTQFLGENFNMNFSHGLVDRLNKEVVEEVRRRKMASNKASQISRRVGFETSKIPSRMLPRASFSLESEDEDKGFEFV